MLPWREHGDLRERLGTVRGEPDHWLSADMNARQVAVLAVVVAILLLNIGLLAAGTFSLGEFLWIGFSVVVVSLISLRWRR